MDNYSAAREMLQAYEEGIWLIKERKQYILLNEYEEKKFVYGEKNLSTSKTVFERGELLLKLVSLNEDAIKPIVSYLRTESRLHQEALPYINTEWEMPEAELPKVVKEFLSAHKKKTSEEVQQIDKETVEYIHREECKVFYILDRMEELYYQAFHKLIQQIPFVISESFSINEIDLIVSILLAECIHIYKEDNYQVNANNSYIPRIFWDDGLKERIKRFLCNPTICSDEEINMLLWKGVKIHFIKLEKEIFQLVNIKSFDELISFEIGNIIECSSDFRKCVRCEVCGRLFYKKPGRGKNICDYRFKDRIMCVNVVEDKFNDYWRHIYDNLKSNLNYYGIPTKEIYQEFYQKVNELLEKYRGKNDFETFKCELDTYYAKMRERMDGYHQHDKDFK